MKKTIFLAAIILFVGKAAFCQAPDPVAGAIANLKTLLTDHVDEKAFLQFDRPYPFYVTGETAYFKAYVTMGARHQPSTLSGILHVDLIDPQNNILKSIAVPLVNGAGAGDFGLPDTLQKGSYRVRAYTQWMRNDASPYFFDQFLSISSPNGMYSGNQNSAQGLKPDLQFFPEGGAMAVDIPSKVAFKAIGTNGLGIDVKGVVVDNENKEVAAINTSHLGMGVFRFIPEEGKTYTAKVSFGNGAQSSVPLPLAQPKGIVLTVNTTDPSKIAIGIRANHQYFAENKNQELNLLVYYGGSIRRYSPKLESSVLGLDLPSASFPTGIVKVSLLSASGVPLNERLVFVQNNDLLKLTLSTNKTSFAPRENVALSLVAKDKDGAGAVGSFSVSVVDESKLLVDENAENTILSSMLLSSEVKGYIEKPNYYFNNVSDQTKTDLDILMMTQGYRRFSWKELMNRQLASTNTYQPEKALDIAGVLKTNSGSPITNCTLTLVPVAGGAPQIQVTDNQGHFDFSNVPFWGGSKFILKATSSSGKKSILTLDAPAGQPAITPGNPLDARYNANADVLASAESYQGQGAYTASNLPVKATLSNETTYPGTSHPKYYSSNLGGPGHADQVILNDQIKNFPTLSVALNGILRDTYFNNGVPYLQTGLIVTSGTQVANPMLIIVDGVNTGSGATIDQVPPANVEAIELLKGANAAIYGVEGGQGVLVITTKTDNRSTEAVSSQMSPGIFSIEPLGFYKAREFYTPKYDAAHPGIPDHRTTIFWKPDVITDISGVTGFSFPNSDSKGTYRVEVQGMDSKGNIGMQVFRYKVQ